ncbi:hypothetical protein F2P81_005927 [Scophthalmus maximus]|uniref:Leucine-rich repeat-containing protein 16B-like n=1 Tax=Scophthalmus maximus TaxID=52904 RepID=A0A6A4TB15_SCOMX|nr:hypothetical protein F2P81_005927 [Scophthalmus maximus]
MLGRDVRKTPRGVGKRSVDATQVAVAFCLRHESIRKIIDKSSIKFVCGIKLDTKNGKSEDRILVLATWRLYFLAPKIPTKVESTFNFLEIRALNSHPEHQVIIDTDKSSFSLRFESREHVNHVVSHINFALSRIFNNSIFAPSICHSDSDLSEGSRKYSPSSETSVETQRACGGFSETYAALCDYNGISCKEEVQWDVDTIYHSQDNREFNLLDFSHLESRDLAVIVASMAYNTWFTKLYCKDLRIGSEVTEQVLHTVSKSSSLEEITLENAGLKSDFPQKMSAALSENPASVIHSLNLAHNSLDNQGVSNLIQQVCRLSKGLRLLNLSKTSLTSKGVVSLSQALCSSDEYSNSLLHLDLSKNPGVLSGEDASNLYLFLSQPNCLVHLDLSGTDCSVDSLFGALLRGCCADLSFLNLSKNSFSHRKVKDTLPLFRQFFSSAFSLTHVSLASMKLPPDVLRALLTGLTSNPHINDLHLDISGCELRTAGAAVIQELFPRVSSVATLDISDNGLDADLLTVLPSLSRHPSLKHLNLGKNFNIKHRVLDEVLQKLVQLIQEEECALQSLSLSDSRLRSRGTMLVNALGSNTCLRKVDLSGNNMEDIGAKMLSKALQINTTLRSVTWDRNSTSASGFLDVARALEHNFTLQYMPLPLSDISQAHRSAPERTEQALTKIQRALVRNNQTQRFSQRQALRLHQGLVTSTAEQVMERLCVRVQQQVCVLRGVGELEEIHAAKQVLKEARNSRALYPSLCELAHVLSVDGPVRQRLDSLAGELAKAADKELQVIVDSMVSLCRELCPLSSAAAERLSPPLSSVSERVSIPRSAIRTALMERAAQDIHRALEEVRLSVVSYLTNSIVDQILQELYATHKTLVSTSMTHDERDTIAIKKRSSRTRRIRPVSTRLTEGDAVFDPPVETDRYWVEDKHRATEGVQVEKQWSEARQSDQHVERQRADDRLQERTFVDPRTADRPTDRYWTESRHPDRHVDRQWTVDRHTQRQIDRKIERQWMGGRQIERSWSENRPTDIQVDNPWTESRQQSRKMDRQVQALHLAQRPLPPYPSDRTPSPKQETDPLKSTEAAATDRHQQDTQGDRHACADVGGGFADGWRGGTGGGRAAPPASKPDPPPQSSKPNLSKLRQRHRLESSDALPALPGTEEEGDTEKDPGKMEKKERDKRRDSESHPPPIPEKNQPMRETYPLLLCRLLFSGRHMDYRTELQVKTASTLRPVTASCCDARGIRLPLSSRSVVVTTVEHFIQQGLTEGGGGEAERRRPTAQHDNIS